MAKKYRFESWYFQGIHPQHDDVAHIDARGRDGWDIAAIYHADGNTFIWFKLEQEA